MAMTQEERDQHNFIFEEDPEDDYEGDYGDDEDDEDGNDGTPIVIMVPPTPKPTPKPPVPEPPPVGSAPKPQPDRFSALAEAIVSIKKAIPTPGVAVGVIQSLLDADGSPFAEDAAARLAAGIPSAKLLEELLAIESLLDKAIEGYPALVAFFTKERRALLFGKK